MKSSKRKSIKTPARAAKRISPYTTKEDAFEANVSFLAVRLRANSKIMSLIDGKTLRLIESIEGYFDEKS